jgi:poly(3-hydroxyalkanoate) depolymerase
MSISSGTTRSNGASTALHVEMRDAGPYRVRTGRTFGAPGSAPLLVFNGIGASLELVAPFARELAAFGIGTIAFDIPGIGGSPAASRPYRFRDMARLAADLLDGYGIAVCDVAGVSWGGALAQEFAYRFPHRTRRLVLCSTSAGAVAVPGKWSALRHMAVPRRFRARRDADTVGGELFGGRFRSDPALFASIAPYLRATQGAGYQMQILAGAGWTSVAWLHEIVAPTLVVMGTDDPIVPVVNGKLLASLIPKARLFTIDDGHLFVVSRARESGELIAGFLST